MRQVGNLILISILFLGTFVPAFAKVQASKAKICALTRSMGLEEIVNAAGIIFKGKLVSHSENYDHDTGLTIRTLKFQVIDPIKGVEKGEVKFNEWARMASPFLNEVKPGETYVFFLNEPSDLGFTSLTGLEQGLISFDNGIPHLRARVLDASKDLDGKSLKSSSNPVPANYSELKEMCQRYMR